MRFPFNIFANLSNEGATQAKNCKDVMMKWKNIFCDYSIYFCNSTDWNKLRIFNFLEIVMWNKQRVQAEFGRKCTSDFCYLFFKVWNFNFLPNILHFILCMLVCMLHACICMVMWFTYVHAEAILDVFLLLLLIYLDSMSH